MMNGDEEPGPGPGAGDYDDELGRGAGTGTGSGDDATSGAAPRAIPVGRALNKYRRQSP